MICSDGTGNTAIKGRGTNVFKLYEAVDLQGHKTDPGKTPQIAFYDDGVGTERLKPRRVLAGAFGWGLGRNVRQLYADLARTYKPRDEIFLFGFSRGGFTVRTLADLVATCGIVDRGRWKTDDKLQDAVEEAYGAYRDRYQTYQTEVSRQIRRRFGAKEPDVPDRLKQVRNLAVNHEDAQDAWRARIRFIGVWDTVDAVGLPFPGLASLINRFIYPFKFPNFKLSPQVDRACHAIAIDDERLTFHPVLWDERCEAKDPPENRIEQVWFAGVHSNVGGGYPQQGMSLVPLVWMMERAEVAGLRFCDLDREIYRERQNVYDKLYDSRAGLAFYYRYKPRDIGKLCEAHGVTPKIHVSAIERIVQGPEAYAPGNLPGASTIVGQPDPAVPVAKLTQNMRAQLGNTRALLDRVKGWVFLRRSSHYAILVLTVAVLALTLRENAAQSGWRTTFGLLTSPTGLLTLVWAALRYALGLVVAMLVFYGLGALAAWRMRLVFSRFWYQGSE